MARCSSLCGVYTLCSKQVQLISLIYISYTAFKSDTFYAKIIPHCLIKLIRISPSLSRVSTRSTPRRCSCYIISDAQLCVLKTDCETISVLSSIKCDDATSKFYPFQTINESIINRGNFLMLYIPLFVRQCEKM